MEAHTNILKFNHEQKSVKIPFDIYDYIESLLEKISTCDKNPQESYTIKTNIQRVDIQYSHTVYLTPTETNMISTGVQILLKCFVQT